MSRIYKRGKNWYVDFEYKGKRYRKSLDTRSKHVAELALKDIDVKIAREKLDLWAPEKIRFEKFAQKFLEWYQMQNAKKSYDDYRVLFHSIISPHFSRVMLSDIRTEMIENYKLERSQQVAASTVNKELTALKHVFNKAIVWGYLHQNPVSDVSRLRVKQKKFRFLSIEEIRKVIKISPVHARPIFMTAIHAGLRKSELFRLEWEDVDFERHCIAIRNKAESHTKNYKNREIPMTAELEYELRKLSTSRQYKHNHIFCKRDGTPHGGELRKTIWRVVRETGIPSFTLHDLRHTFASHLVMEGVDLPTVQKLMGHNNISTTMIYAHLAPDHLINAIQKLHNRFA